MSRPPGPPCYVCGGKNMAKGLCSKHYLAEYRRLNGDQLRAAERVRYAIDAEACRIRSAEFYAANRERRLAACAEYQRQHAEAYRARARAWAAANPEQRRAQAKIDGKRRRSGIGQATPPWADFSAMAVVYEEAQRLTNVTGIPHEVDHVYPLRGKFVSGLHVQGNLEPKPAAANRIKGNRYVPP